MIIKSAGLTDVGLKRKGNEDAFHLEDSLGLYIVADGMGGHLAGEVASRIALDIIIESCRRWIEQENPREDLFGAYDETLTAKGNCILSSIRLANRVIYEMAMHYEQYQGMGTTVVILLVTPDMVIAANVGDSRIYLVRNGRIERLSRDHTIVWEQVEQGIISPEEAALSPLKHVLTRNLGSAEQVDPDIFEIDPGEDDLYILCTDGLTDLVEDNEILEMTFTESEPQTLCQRFVESALERGGHDNTTVVCVSLSAPGRRVKEGMMKRAGFFFVDLLLWAQKGIRNLVP
ncbi:MAG: Stp1/IreP family PP2C-type Ser/Thr phosphatase [Deltaproteobacteria bacterium]|nr:Stp1/IreP family PP2C-type Ser/Thr phosphatase [Deltaproteobacteria bacterium]MBW2016876.1 Stp1/IreP family PP2C-type Ser/Thr phosphatase [Deltaproteobacteria bacterium]MBW2128136.1 Stp1/IreP family PP2C-type Ser/Thr phosphatase [Deltaproteobacteria bacterium]MBW2304583.1 Stp1/IreP family PP2C-type Ser/Thr phosphatase [Deltaproteobacteria bacterium]